MRIGKFQIGMILAIICLAVLVSSFLLPWWTIEQKEISPPHNPIVYANSTHDFGLLGVSTVHEDVAFGETTEISFTTSYSDIEGSDLDLHFTVLAVMMSIGIALTILLLALHVMAAKRARLKSIALILGFVVVFLTLGSAAYLHINVPRAVGDSQDTVSDALQTNLPRIQSFADILLNETSVHSLTTTWGPSAGWYSTFAVCVMMLLSIWLTESRPESKEEQED